MPRNKFHEFWYSSYWNLTNSPVLNDVISTTKMIKASCPTCITFYNELDWAPLEAGFENYHTQVMKIKNALNCFKIKNLVWSLERMSLSMKVSIGLGSIISTQG